ncbi:ATP-binding protein [Streptomyces sp. MUSC 125]|uniref:ATP-binding protein n=1 Tax=Streptomyces sp. MUSC 125 TaxID=1428624 RepID=UPI0006903B2F|nr:ATP-binding protein [Streptomyces sp. MUSC 125]
MTSHKSDSRQGSQRRISQPLGVTPAPLRDLKDYVYQLYVEAGAPQTHRIAVEIGNDDTLPGSPSRTTIHRIITSKELPMGQEDVVSVAMLLARKADRNPGEVQTRVRRMWIAAHLAQPLGSPVKDLDPFALEVHRAISVPGEKSLSTLPAYVQRDHDTTLGTLVDRAAGGESLMVTLVGESSTGKTRACWEALRRLPADWRVWHPFDPTRPDAALVRLREVGPRTVIWLNEAQHYLFAPDARTAEGITAGLRSLLTDRHCEPVLVLATIWPRFWDPLTSPPAAGADDRFDQQRKLLTDHGQCIVVPKAFTESDLRMARRKAHADPRLASALEGATDGEITQFLAGVPELMRRHQCAPPAEKALIHAAMDFRRLGHGPLLPHALLAEAAMGYLKDHELGLLGADWLEEALAYCAMPCHGVPGPLMPVESRSEGLLRRAYRLADYLEQHGRIERRLMCPPASFWEAAIRHCLGTDDSVALACAAQRRGRLRVAAALYGNALTAGNTEVRRELGRLAEGVGDIAKAKEFHEAAWKDDQRARWELVRLRQLMGEPGRAEELAHVAANQGDSSSLTRLARLRQEAGDEEGAQRLTRNAAARGNIRTYAGLARSREEAGDRGGAETLAFLALNWTGSTYALSDLVGMREQAGDGEAAERLVLAAARRGRLRPAIRLAGMRRRSGDRESTIRVLGLAADMGSIFARTEIARLKRRWGDCEGAEEALRSAVGQGSTFALTELARLREKAGDRQATLRLYRTAAERGSSNALAHLALLKEQEGAGEEAERMACSAADEGTTFALLELAYRREQTSDRQGAERLAQTACRAGNSGALVLLARLREKTGDTSGAEVLVRQAAAAGDRQVLNEFVLRRERSGDSEGAESLALAGNGQELLLLARLWESGGRNREAERLFRRAADSGRTQALGELARLKQQAGDHEAAEDHARAAARAGHVEALADLARMCAREGLLGDADRLLKVAVDSGYSDALAQWAELHGQADTRWENLMRYGLTADGDPAQPWSFGFLEEPWLLP